MGCKDPFRYLFGQYVDLKAVNYNQSVQIKKNKKELKKVKQELKRIKEELKEKDRRIEEIRNSETYLVGKALLWLPRKIMGK